MLLKSLGEKYPMKVFQHNLALAVDKKICCHELIKRWHCLVEERRLVVFERLARSIIEMGVSSFCAVWNRHFKKFPIEANQSASCALTNDCTLNKKKKISCVDW